MEDTKKSLEDIRLLIDINEKISKIYESLRLLEEKKEDQEKIE